MAEFDERYKKSAQSFMDQIDNRLTPTFQDTGREITPGDQLRSIFSAPLAAGMAAGSKTGSLKELAKAAMAQFGKDPESAPKFSESMKNLGISDKKYDVNLGPVVGPVKQALVGGEQNVSVSPADLAGFSFDQMTDITNAISPIKTTGVAGTLTKAGSIAPKELLGEAGLATGQKIVQKLTPEAEYVKKTAMHQFANNLKEKFNRFMANPASKANFADREAMIKFRDAHIAQELKNKFGE